MSYRINKAGNLVEKVNGKNIHKYCPYSNNGHSFRECGDWCGLFGNVYVHPKSTNNDPLQALDLCKKVLTGNIKDEREQHEQV